MLTSLYNNDEETEDVKSIKNEHKMNDRVINDEKYHIPSYKLDTLEILM